jgi:hypothetical protein
MPMPPINPPSPQWVSEATSAQDALQRRGAMLIRMCAAWASPGGSVSDLSRAIGYGPNTLHHYCQGGRLVTPEIAIKLEGCFGRRVIRREDLRPDHFLTTDEENPAE